MNVTQGNSLRGIDKKNVRRLGIVKKTVCYYIFSVNKMVQNGLVCGSCHIQSVLIADWYWILKLALNFGCLFTSYYSAGTNLLKTKLHACKLQTGQSISYKCVNQC